MHDFLAACTGWHSTLGPKQNDHHFAEDILKCIFSNENACKVIQFSLMFVLNGSINNKWSIIGTDNGLAPNRRQAIIWTIDGIVYWRIYVSPGLNVLMQYDLSYGN